MEKERHPGDIITPVIFRLASKGLTDGLDMVLLSRRNGYLGLSIIRSGKHDNSGLERYLELVRTFFPKDLRKRIAISTVHKYKGLEKPMVIVLDAVARSYPLIHPDWIFSRIIGDSPEKIIEEERRLFYVALTRAVERLVIITDQGFISLFSKISNAKRISRLSIGKIIHLSWKNQLFCCEGRKPGIQGY